MPAMSAAEVPPPVSHEVRLAGGGIELDRNQLSGRPLEAG
jgi:hypothetical protein